MLFRSHDLNFSLEEIDNINSALDFFETLHAIRYEDYKTKRGMDFDVDNALLDMLGDEIPMVDENGKPVMEEVPLSAAEVKKALDGHNKKIEAFRRAKGMDAPIPPGLAREPKTTKLIPKMMRIEGLPDDKLRENWLIFADAYNQLAAESADEEGLSEDQIKILRAYYNKNYIAYSKMSEFKKLLGAYKPSNSRKPVWENQEWEIFAPSTSDDAAFITHHYNVNKGEGGFETPMW